MPTSTATHPRTSHKTGAAPRRSHPPATNPNVSPAIPGVKTWCPDEARTWAARHSLDSRRRWRRCDVDPDAGGSNARRQHRCNRTCNQSFSKHFLRLLCRASADVGAWSGPEAALVCKTANDPGNSFLCQSRPCPGALVNMHRSLSKSVLVPGDRHGA